MKIVVATQNLGKLKELQTLLNELPVELVTLADYPDMPEVMEDGKTFEANASKKAIKTARWTKCWALADDSGLCVEALEGEPGVHSARYAGEAKDSAANCRKLLQALNHVSDEQRTAYFICVMALANPQGEVETATGKCEGKIARDCRGEGGFGYDPLFIYEALDKTFAQLSAEEKNKISHRFKAVEKIKQVIKNKCV